VATSDLAAFDAFPRAAGVALPVFSLRTRTDTGGGGLLDLIPLIDWLARWHQRVLQILPINEADPDQASPYSALSAFAIDPSYISAPRVPEVQANAAAQAWMRSPQLRRKLSAMREAHRRQRLEAYQFNMRLLEFGFAQFEASSQTERAQQFKVFCEQSAGWLTDYAEFRAFKELWAFAPWETWPDALRDREDRIVADLRLRLARRIRFAKYLQWVAAEQWAAVRAHAHARGVLLKGDLPFVCGRDSADVWAQPHLFDLSSSAGAPPDAFSPTGQAWGLPLYDWRAMRARGFEWWRRRARQASTLYDLFRIDHVVGLYRTFAIPTNHGGTTGFVPADEPEQRNQGHTLIGALVAEARPARIVAEDLGTVPPWVRQSLTRLDVPGYRVLRWEYEQGRMIDPRTYPTLSIATTGTHDTETLIDWWNTLLPTEQAAALEALHLNSVAPVWPAPHIPLLQRLYEAPSYLTILPLQDLFGWPDRINVPATVADANWSYRIPVAIEDLDRVPGIRARMTLLRDMVDDAGRA
jgi:4-alpha-glucanotransferase